MKTGRYNLRDLLTHNEIEQIIIPEIQRDYVWQQENVEKLLESIIKKYQKKEKHTFKILVDEKAIEHSSINEYLVKEYEKLNYSLKIGFIYAYHDSEYAGKFFLIDGQQRLTTLYLLLLSLYSKCSLPNKFKDLYFKSGRLKLDYKVREASHQFLYDFVSCVIEGKDIKKSSLYYRYEYESDETVKNLLANYKLLTKKVDNIDAPYEFLLFVEQFIEFNYFDTHLSEQGEQLYIYMNSRGENLSYQEIIRSAIVQKREDLEAKKQVGKNWEKWQNFFWRNKKGTRKENENADEGFNEFLKWATIIHICESENPDIQIKDKKDKKKQTPREAKGNYIRRFDEPNEIREQQEILKKYLEVNIDEPYLNNIYQALVTLQQVSKNSIYIPFSTNYLCNDFLVREYVYLLPLLYYISSIEWQDENDKLEDIERMAMFLKNITFFDAVTRDPVSFTTYAIDLIKKLIDNGDKDIINFPSISLENILTKAEKHKINAYAQKNTERKSLEQFIWNITLNEDLSKFLEGDISIIFDCFNYEISNMNSHYNAQDIVLLKNYQAIIEKIIYTYRTDDRLRRTFLTYGDYRIYDNGGSQNFGEWIPRFSFIQNTQEWLGIFKEKKETGANIIILEMLKDFKVQLSNGDINPLEVEQYFESRISSYVTNDWKAPFIKIPSILQYCQNKKVLFGKENRIILLASKKATNAREIQCQILTDKCSDRNCWIWKHNICVFDFAYNPNTFEIEYKNWGSKEFSLDIKYEKNEWTFTLFYRDEKLNQKKLAPFLKADWILANDRVKKVNNVLYTDAPNLSILENIKQVSSKIDLIFNEITNVLTSS